MFFGNQTEKLQYACEKAIQKAKYCRILGYVPCRIIVYAAPVFALSTGVEKVTMLC